MLAFCLSKNQYRLKTMINPDIKNIKALTIAKWIANGWEVEVITDNLAALYNIQNSKQIIIGSQLRTVYVSEEVYKLLKSADLSGGNTNG